MSKHTIEQDLAFVEGKVTAFARAVSLKRATVAAVIGGALQVLVVTHTITPDVQNHVNQGISGALAFVSTVAAGAWIYKGTTPADPALIPKDDTGTPLVPAAVAAKLIKAVSDNQMIEATVTPIDESGTSVIDVPEAADPLAIPAAPDAPTQTAAPASP